MLGSIWSNQIDIVIHRDAEWLIAPALKTRTVFQTKSYEGSTPSLTFCSSKRGVSYENYLPPSLFAIIILIFLLQRPQVVIFLSSWLAS